MAETLAKDHDATPRVQHLGQREEELGSRQFKQLH